MRARWTVTEPWPAATLSDRVGRVAERALWQLQRHAEHAPPQEEQKEEVFPLVLRRAQERQQGVVHVHLHLQLPVGEHRLAGPCEHPGATTPP